MSRNTVLRLIDANANRVLEGLRVCEDVIRFHLEHPALFRRIRRLRHATALAIRALPAPIRELVAARESRRDLGRAAPGSPLGSLEQVLIINLQRAKEALRVLEECARVIAPRASRTFQRLRFEVYDVERTVLLCVATVRHR